MIPRLEHETFMKNPGKWPQWPFLPLVRRNGKEPYLGVMVDSDKNGGIWKRTVIITNLIPLMEGKVNIKKCPLLRYDNLSKLLDDGWEVD